MLNLSTHNPQTSPSPNRRMGKPPVSLKLLIDTQTKRVLFAEASKDCVDFLFYTLSLPLAKFIALLRKEGMVGSLANLYKSVENLNETYIQSNKTKDDLLKPVSVSSVPLLAVEHSLAGKKKSFYRCGQCQYNYNTNISDSPNTACPQCGRVMDSPLNYVAPSQKKELSLSRKGGFVKGVVTYMVMDDLVVTPMSTISSLTLLTKFNVKDVGALEEKVVNLGMLEAVKLLKASLETDKVLTTVFLKGKRPATTAA